MGVRAFRFTREPIDPSAGRAALAHPDCGGYASFEGWVRDHNEGQRVRHLEYEAFEALAVREGERIVAEACERFGVEHAACIHRIGDLAIGEMAVWVGVAAPHREEAFLACRYIIDEVKHRVPIWKKEHYVSGDSGWVNCERCAAPAAAAAGDAHGHVSHGHASRGHVHAAPAPAGAAALQPDYSRQVALREVGPDGQRKLRAARVLVVGCGGLGVPVMTYLAGAGVGQLGLVDGDRLEASNLHRQTLYALAEVGEPKAALAAARLRALNPEVQTRVHALRLDAASAAGLIGQYDVVVDCTDNFATKFTLNDVCVSLRKPLVLASVYQFEGQLQVVRADRDGACLRCIWPSATRDGIVGNCAQAGVLGPVPGVFGALQAFETLRLLLGMQERSGDEIVVLDLMSLSVARLRVHRAADCPGHAQRAALAAAGATSEPLELAFASVADAQRAGYAVVDIREPQERASAAPAALEPVPLVPLGQLLHGDPPFVPSGPTLLLCASGRRSLAATQELRERGVSGVWSLRGGLAALQS